MIQVTNQAEAVLAINSVSEWLAAGAPGLTEQVSEGALVSPIERLVDRMCHELLDAANVDDMGGCPLCKS